MTEIGLAQGENGRGHRIHSLPRHAWLDGDRIGKPLAYGIGFGLLFLGHVHIFLDIL